MTDFYSSITERIISLEVDSDDSYKIKTRDGKENGKMARE